MSPTKHNTKLLEDIILFKTSATLDQKADSRAHRKQLKLLFMRDQQNDNKQMLLKEKKNIARH